MYHIYLRGTKSKSITETVIEVHIQNDFKGQDHILFHVVLL